MKHYTKAEKKMAMFIKHMCEEQMYCYECQVEEECGKYFYADHPEENSWEEIVDRFEEVE